MRQNTGLLLLLGTAMLFVTLASCGQKEPRPAGALRPDELPPTPYAAAQPKAVQPRPPTPTPVPALERQVVLEFAVAHRAADQEWEQLQADFDAWRLSLTACEASSARVSIAGFAGSIISIAESARKLPRSPIVRELADEVVAAAESEEGGLRQLRDDWTPEDPAAFENVETQRAEASGMRKQVGDKLSDLQAGAEDSFRAEVDEFSLAFDELEADWDRFHDSYDALGAEAAELPVSTVIGEVGRLVEEFNDIVIAVRELPAVKPTLPVVQLLSEAAEKEELALRAVRSSLDFTLLDAQVVETNASRRQAAQALAEVVDVTSEESGVILGAFADQYASLSRDWDAFHQEYDRWRIREGGCDRAEVIAALGRFALQYGELAGKVRDLPRATFLQPLGELLVEAAEGEESGLWDLRDGWRPFDARAYIAYDEARSAAGRLRRQVAVGVQELSARYGIAASELPGD